MTTTTKETKAKEKKMAKQTNEMRYRTADERVRAFESQHCERYDYCAQCQYNSSCGGIDGRTIGLRIMAHWLALEADEEKPEPCFYCGGNVNVYDYNRVGHTVKFICEKCGAELSLNTNKADAIAAHNRVARAVRAATEGEVK